jgi:hypothetical protein
MEQHRNNKGPLWLALGALVAGAILGASYFVGERIDDAAARTGSSTRGNDPGSIQDLPPGSPQQRERADSETPR